MATAIAFVLCPSALAGGGIAPDPSPGGTGAVQPDATPGSQPVRRTAAVVKAPAAKPRVLGTTTATSSTPSTRTTSTPATQTQAPRVSNARASAPTAPKPRPVTPKPKPHTVVPAVKTTPATRVSERPIGHRRSAATALGFDTVRLPVPSPDDGRGLLLAGLALLALASASGAFLGLVHRYRRDLGAA